MGEWGKQTISIANTKLRALSQIETKHMRMKAWSDHALHYQ
jgi:hypothetical protein